MTKHKGVSLMLRSGKKTRTKIPLQIQEKKCGLSGYNAQGCGLDE